MLTINIKEKEMYDPEANLFYTVKGETLHLEHSLRSIALWEAKWKVPFISSVEKNTEQTLDYIRCMTINKNVDPSLYRCLTASDFKAIQEYIDDPMTATTFNEDNIRKSSENPQGSRPRKRNVKPITSEEIYYQMTALNIPFDCDKWHFNRLQTLIRVCAIKNAPPKKMSKRDVMSRNRALNDARRASMHTNG